MITTKWTMILYLARLYTAGIAALFLGLIAIMALFDGIEVLRILSKTGNNQLDMVLYMAVLKAPGNILKIASFVMLFAGMIVMGGLQKRQELVVMRVSGASLWQILMPMFAVAFLYGITLVTVIHPLSSLTERLYDQYEHQVLNKGSNTVSLLDQGLWLRQESDGSLTPSYILHAERVALPGWTLSNVMVLTFGPNNKFLSRIDADRAILKNGYWHIDNAMSPSSTSPSPDSMYQFKTSLTRDDLDNSFVSSNAVSFWSMPSLIRTLEQTGFPTLPLRVQFGSLLMLPFLCMTLVMIAAVVSLRSTRSGGAVRQILAGVLIGFFMFFLNNFLMALGGSGQIPVWLSVISPALLTAAAGTIAILSIEDQ